MGDSIVDTSNIPAARIFAVVVVYKLSPLQSLTLQTLLHATQMVPADQLQPCILIWDNTPGGQDPGDLPPEVLYRSAPENPGLAQAYNYALHLAQEQGYEWLLTLDQDSALPPDFMMRIAELVRNLRSNVQIGAIVPRVEGDSHNISPYRHFLGAIPRWFPYGFVGMRNDAVFALNSAATIRIDALHKVGGYDPLFPLDVSDINLFYHLHCAGYKVFIAGDLVVLHELSVLNKNKRMSIERYHRQLQDECAFWDMHLGLLARMERLLRLAVRAYKDSHSPENHRFRDEALREIRRRILNRRYSRIRAWKNWAATRSMSSAMPAQDAMSGKREANL